MRNLLLNNLVESLTKNEKGYFIKSLSKKDSPYSKLFKMMASQKKHDEKQIRAEFEGTYIGNNFSFAKNYLYHAILKSLIQYGASKKDTYYYFASVKLLYQKGLYRNCAKMLKQVYKKATLYNDYLSILRVIQYAKLLFHSNLHFDKDLISIINLESEILKRQQIVSTFQSILFEIKNLRVSVGGMKNKISMEKINKIRNHNYLNDKSKLIDSYCKYMYHEIMFLIGFLSDEKRLTKKHILSLQIMVNDKIYTDYLTDYRKIDISKQLIRYSILKNNFENAQSNLTLLKGLLSTTKNVNQTEIISTYAYFYSFQTDLLLNQKKFNIITVLFAEIDLFIAKNKKIIPEEFFVVIKGNMLVLRFMMRDYQKVVDLANSILINNKLNLRKDIIISVMLTETMAFYELNKIELFESRTIAFKRYLAQHKIEEITWKLFSDFLHKILIGNKIEKISRELILELDKLPTSRITLDLEFLIDWVKSKAKK